MPSSERVAFVATLAGEPPARVTRMLRALHAQDWDGPLDLVIAAPPFDLPALAPVVATWTRGRATVVVNPTGERATGLNRAVDQAEADYLVRVDARSQLPPDHVRRTVTVLHEDESVGVVGGHQVAEAGDGDGARGAGIARAFGNRIVSGGAAYRDRRRSGDVDTVYLGTFRRREIVALRYDERLVANEDFDLCRRFASAGMRVVLLADLDVAYEPRPGYRAVFEQYLAFGRAKARYWRLTGARPNRRQAAALACAGSALLATAVLTVTRPRLLPVLAAGGLVAAGMIDAVGSDRPARARERAAALPAVAAMQVGWVTGVLGQALRSGDVEHALERDPGVLGGDRVDGDPVHHLAAGE